MDPWGRWWELNFALVLNCLSTLVAANSRVVNIHLPRFQIRPRIPVLANGTKKSKKVQKSHDKVVALTGSDLDLGSFGREDSTLILLPSERLAPGFVEGYLVQNSRSYYHPQHQQMESTKQTAKTLLRLS